MNSDNLHSNLKEFIRHELEPDEKIQWVGKPRSKYVKFYLYFIPTTLFGISFMAPMIIWALNINWSKWDGPSTTALTLLIMTWITVCIGIISIPYWVKKSTDASRYILTNKRAIIFTQAFIDTTIKSFDISYLYHLEMNPDGSGDIYFGLESQYRDVDLVSKYGFIDLDDAKSVENILRKQIDVECA
jgi:hypothetical protein